jgi:hypothetical protein
MIAMQNVERCHCVLAPPHHQFLVPHPYQTKNSCEAFEIHNLPQNLPTGSFKYALHNCGASVESHGSYPFIYIGFFHLG